MDTLQVIAEPKRRQILALIWDRELAAANIAAEFDVTFGAISQHLAVLRQADLVKMRKEGNRRIYSADQDALGPFRDVLESMWKDTLGNLASEIEASESDHK